MTVVPLIPQAAAPAWTEAYCGIPHRTLGRDPAGLDCWGASRLIAKERLGIDLPAYVAGYNGVAHEDAEDINRLLTSGKSDWAEILPKDGRDWRAWFAAAEPMLVEGDFIEMRFWNVPCHVAYFVAPGWAIHVIEGRQTCLLPYRDADWRHKVTGFYRHSSRLAAHPIG